MAEQMTKAHVDKMKQILEAIAELREKEAAWLEELAVLLGGGVGIGALLKQAERAFAAAWSTRYPGVYMWRYAVDRPNMKRLLKSMPLEILARRMTTFIRNEDQFFIRARHSFPTFVATINQHVDEGETPEDLRLEAPAPADCRCDPPCRSDQEHTKRKLAAVRG